MRRRRSARREGGRAALRGNGTSVGRFGDARAPAGTPLALAGRRRGQGWDKPLKTVIDTKIKRNWSILCEVVWARREFAWQSVPDEGDVSRLHVTRTE